MHQPITKTVIMNRAVPGSGKSSYTARICLSLAKAGACCSVHSTDRFFMKGNRYCFDAQKLGEYHNCNLAGFLADLAKGVDVVICDNTNLLPWETLPYTRAVRRHGYQVIFLNFSPRELGEHVRSQQVTPEKPDAHEVPEERLKAFIHDYYCYESLLERDAVPMPDTQRDYCWDARRCRPRETGAPAAPFDSDWVVHITPEEYHCRKGSIGTEVLGMMMG